MEKAISRLFEIEEKANNIIKRANEEKVRLHDEFENELENMEKTISSDNNKRILEFKQSVEKNYEQEKQQLMQKSEQQLKELDVLYKEKHTDLVNQLFNNIIRS